MAADLRTMDEMVRAFSSHMHLLSLEGDLRGRASRVKAVRRRFRDCLRDAVARFVREYPGSDGLEILSAMYWDGDSQVSTAVNQGYKKAAGQAFRPYPREEPDVCESCGGPVPVTSRHGHRVFRCEGCVEADREEVRRSDLAWKEAQVAELERLRSLPYREYLQTPHWQEIRVRTLRRAKYRCMLCNVDAPLDVHHRTYERLGFEEWNDTIALCRRCHGSFHSEAKVG